MFRCVEICPWFSRTISYRRVSIIGSNTDAWALQMRRWSSRGGSSSAGSAA